MIKQLTKLLICFTLLTLTTSQPPSTTGGPCSSTNSCPHLHICTNSTCLHKFIWPPTTIEIIGTILLFIFVGLGNAGGIGGVFLIRPVLVYMFNYSPESANELSFSLLFGGMLGGYIFRVWRREPTTAKPVIHYEISLVSLPILMFGANLGSILNRVFPAAIDFLIQIYFLTTTLIKMWRNYKKIRAQENRFIMAPVQVLHHDNVAVIEEPEITCAPPDNKPQNEQERTANDNANISTRVDVDRTANENANASVRVETGADQQINREKLKEEANKAAVLAEIIIEEHRLFPLKKNFQLTALMACYILLFLFRGTYYSDSIVGVEKCSWLFWFIYCAVFPLSVFFHFRASRLITKEHNRRQYAGYKFKEKFIMTPEKMPLLRKICLMSGFLTSISGIGIGVRLISGLMALGMQPYSAIATSGYFVLYVSITYLSVFFGSRLLTLAEILYYMAISFLAGFTVTFVLYYCMKRHRTSINVMALLIIIVLGILGAWFNIIYRSILNPKYLLFQGEICKIN